MILQFSLTFNIGLKSPSLKALTIAFLKCLPSIFQSFAEQALYYFAEKYKQEGKLSKMLKGDVIWKSSKGNRKTKIFTIFGIIKLPQLQVLIKQTGKKIYITRLLLGIEKYKLIPEYTKKIIALLAAMSPYRAVKKSFILLTGVKISLASISKSVIDIGKKIKFKIDKECSNIFESDGTGIPIINSSKRGKEIKILVQRRKDGKLKVAGINIGEYKKGWKRLFTPLKKVVNYFNRIFLITDGDYSILDNVKENVKIIVQRCLWHIPHEMKYTLWKDKVKRVNFRWKYVLARIIEICNIKGLRREEEEVRKEIIKKKEKSLDELIRYCDENGMKHTFIYLNNARRDIFRGIREGLLNGTVSLLERMMRTINQRIDIGKWSNDGGLSICKIIAAYYYNGFDI